LPRGFAHEISDNFFAAQQPIYELKLLKKCLNRLLFYFRNFITRKNLRLLVAFSANGRVENIPVLTSLGYGLDAQAIKAAKRIKFEPATRDGKPVMSVKTVEYSFTIY